jgi:hypothetical protein
MTMVTAGAYRLKPGNRENSSEIALNCGSSGVPNGDYMQTRAGATCGFTNGRLVIEGSFPA